MSDDTTLRRSSLHALASPAAWGAAMACLAVGLAGTAATAAWLWSKAQGEPWDLLDGTTWLIAGTAVSLSWRLATLATMATGALWARARNAGHDIGAGQLLARLAERGWLLLRLTVFWAAINRTLKWLGRRSRLLRPLTWLARGATTTSTVASVVAVAKREIPETAREARSVGRAMVGGRLQVVVHLVLAAVVAAPVAATLIASGVLSAGTAQIVTLAAVLPVAFATFGIVCGVALFNTADRRGRRRAARRESPFGRLFGA